MLNIELGGADVLAKAVDSNNVSTIMHSFYWILCSNMSAKLNNVLIGTQYPDS